MVQAYKTKDRFEANYNAEAIVNAKYQLIQKCFNDRQMGIFKRFYFIFRALEVLDLLFTFQFNSRLECFIAKFKTAELMSGAKKQKYPSALANLMQDEFDAFDQSKLLLQTFI